MSANRMHFPNTVHFVTNRTEQEMFLLLPTKAVTNIIQTWFARSLCLHGDGLEVYAFIFLSNHFHLLVNDTKGTLAEFMCYFQANIAKAINRQLGRRGSFWAREYDDVIVDGTDEFFDRYAYTLCNAVKAGLVNQADEWIGWNSLAGALSDGTYCFEMLDRTKLHNATRRGQHVDKSKFTQRWAFELTSPPMLKNLPKAEKNQRIEALIRSAESDYRALRGNKPPLGIKKVLKQRHTDRPRNPAFRPKIKVFCFDRQRRKELIESYRNFVGNYREIFDDYRKAALKRRRPNVDWPSGSYPPSCWRPILHERAA